MSKADAARCLYHLLGRPSKAEFVKLLGSHYLMNCPVTGADAERATIMYGPDVTTLKGKTTRTGEAARVPCFDLVPVPTHVHEH